MTKILRLFVYSFICLFVYLFIPHSYVLAGGEFQADYDVQYAVSPTGTTIVTQNIILTNKKTNLYPQKYSITIDSTNIKNIIAYDSREIVKTDISQADGKTQIMLTFNDRVIGLGKKLHFTLRFENGDIAQKNGSIWEVNVPGIATDEDIATYEVSLSVPQTFGPNAYMTPMPASGNKWNKSQMTSGGISAAYGTTQSFDVGLAYFIDNPTIGPVQTEIALPPDTAYQTVAITAIEPRPVSVVRDVDGNWLAQYTLLPGEHKIINAKLHIDVSLKPKETYTEIIQENLYLRPQKYWESDAKEIKELAKRYTTPREIYNYVVSTLAYDYSRVKETPIRKGALQTIAAPQNSICMEFTDLFIAIARAAGIPARESVGYAYTNNARLRPLSLVTDVLHAWPEYYDSEKKLWIAVDPTWENTTRGVNYFDKLDFNHIVFAVHGKSSEYPGPAGFYRQNGKTTRDVGVQFTDVPFVMPMAKLTSTFSFPKIVTAGIHATGKLIIENPSGVSMPSATVVLQSSPVDMHLTKTEKYLPPYAKLEIPLSMTIPDYLQAGTGRFSLNVNGETQSHIFTIQPITQYFLIPIICFSAILILLLVYLSTRHLWKKRSKK